MTRMDQISVCKWSGRARFYKWLGLVRLQTAISPSLVTDTPSNQTWPRNGCGLESPHDINDLPGSLPPARSAPYSLPTLFGSLFFSPKAISFCGPGQTE